MVSDTYAPDRSHRAETAALELVSAVALGGGDDSDLLVLAASVAAGMDAPVWAALSHAARERDLVTRRVNQFHTTTTGVAASLAGHTVVLGEAQLLRDLGVPLEGLGGWPERLRQRGERVLFVAVDGRAAGLLGLMTARNRLTRTDTTEDAMRDPRSITNSFPTRTNDLPEARPLECVTLADGDRFHLRIAPVTKRIGEAMVRMLAYNGSVPGPVLRVQQGSEVLVDVVNEGDLEATVHWHG